MKPRMTLDEIAQASARLSALSDRLVSESVAIGNMWPKTEASKFMNAMDAARSKLLNARLELESLACKLHGNYAGMSAMHSGRRSATATKSSADRVASLKVSAVHMNGTESVLIHDTLSDDHRTYDVDINGQARGVWIAPIDTPAWSPPSDLDKADVEEWWTKGTIRGVKPDSSNGAPF